MSSLFDDPIFLRDMIMDHYKYPRNHGLDISDLYKKVRENSDSCIDDITVATRIEDGIIKDIKFDGVACAISTASTSMMSELLIGKSIDEAKDIISNYTNMVNDVGEYDADKLNELIAFKNVNKQANRIKCATIGFKAISKLLEKDESNG